MADSGAFISRLIGLDREAAWHEAVAKLPCPVAHTHAYCRALAAASQGSIVLYCAERGDETLLCPLAIRQPSPGLPDVYSPYGFAGFVTNASAGSALRRAWADFATEQGFVAAYVMQHPALDPPWEEAFSNGRLAFVMDLRHSEETLWAGLDQTHRYEIRRCQRDGLRVIEGAAAARAFLDLYPGTMDRLGAGGIYRFPQATLAAFRALEGAVVLAVHTPAGQVPAAALFLRHGGMGEYFLAAARPEARGYSRLLVWEGMRRLKARGVSRLNLGGGIREGDGLEAFKRRFGGEARPLRTMRQVLRPEAYRELCRDNGCREDDEGYFPAYWRPKPQSDMVNSRPGERNVDSPCPLPSPLTLSRQRERGTKACSTSSKEGEHD